MPDLAATTPGLFPLPDWAKEDLSDLKGHQKSDLITGDEGAELEAVYDEARTEVIEWQTDAGLDAVVEGQLRWDDMLAHPLAVHDSVETRGIVRYYDNNNFYREPVIQGELTPDGDLATELSAAVERTDRLQAVVPGPYSLADLATDEYYGESFLSAVADFLAGEVEQFPHVESVWVLEPSLVVHPPDAEEAERVREALDAVATAVDAEVVVHTYWGAIDGHVYSNLLDASIDVIGFDMVTAPDGNLTTITEYGTTDDVALGVVDGQNTRVESVANIRQLVQRVEDDTPGTDIETAHLTSNTELFYLPVSKAMAKLDALGSAAKAEVAI